MGAACASKRFIFGFIWVIKLLRDEIVFFGKKRGNFDVITILLEEHVARNIGPVQIEL